ncbi:MAG: YqaA family protein [Mangrovicoccus sp.]
MSDATLSPSRDINDYPEWIQWLAGSRPGIALLSALESSFIPIPLELILAPLMVSQPRKAFTMALAALLGCIAGSFALYGLALLLMDPVVTPLLSQLGLESDFKDMQDKLKGDGLFWTVALISLSPAPVQLGSLGAGAIAGNPLIFAAAIIASRGIRYFGLAGLAWWLGPKLQNLSLPSTTKLIAAIATIIAVYILGRLIL